MRRPVSCLLVIVTSLFGAACDNGPEPTTPTQPPTVTETFTGSLSPNAATTHPFTTQAAGAITATLTALEPSDRGAVGFSMGTWNGSACQIVLANDLAVASAILTGTTQTAANLCVRMYDQGTLTAGPVNYTVQVVHP